MLNLSHFQESLMAFAEAPNADEITHLLKRFCQELGFDNFIYALRIPTQFNESRVVMIKGFPDSWLDHYFQNAYYVQDPVVRYCSQHIVPIAWANLDKVDPAMRGDSESRRIMNEAGDFGLYTGISMPVHSPQGELGILSMTLDRRHPNALAIVETAQPYVQLLAGYLHEAVRRVFGLMDRDQLWQLTHREQECLRWTADGKTSWEIAQLLNMSERTVNFHLTNSINKLAVSNRQHAVAKAVLHGLINPHPF